MSPVFVVTFTPFSAALTSTGTAVSDENSNVEKVDKALE